MAIPKNKAELVAAIEMSYGKLKEELQSIPANLTGGKELEGHAKNVVISIHDLVAYLLGWGQLVLKWNEKKDKGLPVDFPETGYKWNELGKLAQKFYADYEDENYSSLLKKLDKTVNQILLLIEKKTNKQLYEINWYDKWPPRENDPAEYFLAVRQCEKQDT